MSDCVGGHCVTCADEALPMQVVSVDAADGLAECAGENGGRATVEVGLVEPVAVGDTVLVHAAVALARVEVAA